MKRLFDFIPGQVAMAHDRYFVTVWAKWEKVGQHQRTWYLCSPMDEEKDYIEFLPEASIQLVEGEVDPTKPIAFQELPEEYLKGGIAILDSAHPEKDYGWAYGIATLGEGVDKKSWSIGVDGSGYPWWLVALTETMVLANSWSFYGDHMDDDDPFAEWPAFLASAPKLVDLIAA